MINRTNKGFSLIEVVVAVFIVGLVSAPIYYLFSTSTRMNVTSRHIAIAIGLANSLLNTIKAIPITDLSELPATEDKMLYGPLALSSLGISECPDGSEEYKRYLQIIRKTWPGTGKEFFHIAVRVRWINPISKVEQSYSVQTLNPCPEP